MAIIVVIGVKFNVGDGRWRLRILTKFQVVWRADECVLLEVVLEVLLTCGTKESITCQMWLMVCADMKIM